MSIQYHSGEVIKMRSENIVFTDVNTVDLLEQELLELGDDEIRVSTRVSTIS